MLYIFHMPLDDFSSPPLHLHLHLRRMIFKCSCETVFKKKQLLLEHFHQNASKRVTSVFKCPECNSVFPQKHLLMQHFKVKSCRSSFSST